jgi:hypothetical protein
MMDQHQLKIQEEVIPILFGALGDGYEVTVTDRTTNTSVSAFSPDSMEEAKSKALDEFYENKT